MSNEETRELATMETALMPGSGSLALAMMSDQEFETRLQQLQVAQRRAERIKAAIMVKDVDYGVIPGTGDKPTLLKSGAEKLCMAFRLVATFRETIGYGDGDARPDITVDTVCNLHLGDADGPVVGQGVGNANSWEKRYRRRPAELSCPRCGVMGAITKSKRDGGWFCWSKKGGCGTEYPPGAPEIERQPRGQMDNPDPYDLLNTLKKISKKRSHVDAALTTTGTSGLFTQDLDELAPESRTHTQRQDAGGGHVGNGKREEPVEPAAFATQLRALAKRSDAKWSTSIRETRMKALVDGLLKIGMSPEEMAALSGAVEFVGQLSDLSNGMVAVLLGHISRPEALRSLAAWQIEREKAEREMPESTPEQPTEAATQPGDIPF